MSKRPPAETTRAQSLLAQPEEGSTSSHLGQLLPTDHIVPSVFSKRRAGGAKAARRCCGNSWHCEQDAASVLRTWEGCRREGSCSQFNFSLFLSEKKRDFKSVLRTQHSFSKQQGAYPFRLARILTQATPDHPLIQQSRKQTYCTSSTPFWSLLCMVAQS